jgi:TonB family protein
MAKLLLVIIVGAMHAIVILLLSSTVFTKKGFDYQNQIAVNLLEKNTLPLHKMRVTMKQNAVIVNTPVKLKQSKSSQIVLQTDKAKEISSTAINNIDSTKIESHILEDNKKKFITNAVLDNSTRTKQYKPLPIITQHAQYLYNPPPIYPRFARQRGYQGKVALNLLISNTGIVTKIKLLQSSGYKILDNSAIKTVKQWRFVPIHPVKITSLDVWYKQNINFQLDKQVKDKQYSQLLVRNDI